MTVSIWEMGTLLSVLLYWNSESLVHFHMSMSFRLGFSRKILTGRCTVQSLHHFPPPNHTSRWKKIPSEMKSPWNTSSTSQQKEEFSFVEHLISHKL